MEKTKQNKQKKSCVVEWEDRMSSESRFDGKENKEVGSFIIMCQRVVTTWSDLTSDQGLIITNRVTAGELDNLSELGT